MQTVGDILRAEREKQGISVKDVEKATSIRALYIQAIEDGNYSIMPGEVYLKGFIRNYANFLGLQGQELVDIYRQSLPAETPVNEPEKIEKYRRPPVKRNWGKLLTSIVILLLIIAAAWFAWAFWSQQPEKPKPQTQQQPQSQVAPAPAPAPAPVTPPAAPPTAQQQQNPNQTPGTKPVVVTAKFSGQTWTLVTADGKDIYEGIPKNGETMTWNADQNVVVKLGNAAAADITFNGQAQPKLGGEGEVVIKTFSNPAVIKKP